MLSAEDITKKSKSNLAFALLCLPKQRREDMVTFYAFCRIIDDIADSDDTPVAERQALLERWSQSIAAEEKCSDLSVVQPLTIELLRKYEIDKSLLLELIRGCKSDILGNLRFSTWKQLETYTYRVAGCVGLSSIKIFGCCHPDSEIYALKLGHALQLTNILRDVGHDLLNGNRIYLPQDEMLQFKYSEQDLMEKVYDGRFIAMMNFHADRAEKFYQEAREALPKSDQKALRASESMRKIYYNILQKMKRDHFQVFSKHYKLSKLKKIYHLIT